MSQMSGVPIDLSQPSLYRKHSIMGVNIIQLIERAVSALAIAFNPTFWKYVKVKAQPSILLSKTLRCVQG